MSFLKRIFSTNTAEPAQRVRICIECGMPVADHKEWCSIRRGQAGDGAAERREAVSPVDHVNVPPASVALRRSRVS